MGAVASPQIVGRYAIYDKIAQGGMASVHFGRLQGPAGFSRTVAVKRLHPHLAEEPEFLSTLIDEARLAARIHHPNVVPTLDVVSEKGELLVVMEYVRGESLSRLVRAESTRTRRVPLPIASAIMVGALHGLHAAHEATSDRGTPLGIVHRDVSPQNILVGVDGVPRIIDFGVAKAAGRLQTTGEGVVKGKLAYMAPEQLSGVPATRLVDVYAIGVVFWEMLCGRGLFRADSDAALVVRVLAGASEPPSLHAPDVPPELDALVMTALSRDPAARFPSALDMADRLVRVVPPALSRDVGLWLEDLAQESLARRASALAAIEGGSGSHAVSLPAVATSKSAVAAESTTPSSGTEAAQDSSLTVEMPGAASRRRLRRAWLVGGVSTAALLAVGAATLVRFRESASAPASTGAPAMTSAPAAEGPSAAVPPAPSVAEPPPAVARPAPSATPPAASTSTAARASTRATPAPQPRPATQPARTTPSARPCTVRAYVDESGFKRYAEDCK